MHTPYTYARDYLHGFALYQRRDDTPRGYIADLKLLAFTIERMRDEEADRMRDAGASWSEIGEVFGMSRQGARQRFGA